MIPIVAALGGIGIWVLGSRMVVPGLLDWLYASGPAAIADRVMAGRAQQPLSAYLDEWWTRLPSFDYVVVTTLLLFTIGWITVRWVRRTPWDPRADRVEPQSRLGRVGQWGLVGAGLGAYAGLTESYHLAAKLLYLRETPSEYVMVAPESLWLVIVVDMVALGTLGALCGGVASWFKHPRTRSIGLTLLTATGAASLLGLTGRIHIAVVAFLAFAVGTRLAAVLAPRWRTLVRGSRASVAVGIAITVLLAVGLSMAERRRAEPAGAIVTEASARNVLLIVLDTERAQNWGLFGAERETTRRMEEWAASGIVYDRALAPSNWTLPSHASLLTGLPSWKLDVDWSNPLDPSFVTLAEFFGARGYRTGGFAGNLFFLGEHFGLAQGFQRWDDHRPTFQFALTSSWVVRESYEGLRNLLGLGPVFIEKTSEQVAGPFLDWVGDGSVPFFAMLNFMDAHEPYAPPDEHRRYSSVGDPFWLFRGDEAAPYSADEIQALENAYDDEIALLDRDVGRLLEALEERGLLENTVVILTSDHGESFGENGWMNHHTTNMHRTLLHVPLVAFGADLPAGERIADPVSVSRVPATVASWAGFSDHPFPGSPLWRADGSQGPIEPAASSFHGWFSLVDGDLHYLRNADGTERLYHWVHDPWEERDLVADPAYAARLPRVRALLERLVADPDLLPPKD